MKRLKKMLKAKTPVVLSVPLLLCFVTFITNLIKSLRDGNIDSDEFHQLLSTSDGFEAVILFAIMFVLKDKNK